MRPLLRAVLLVLCLPAFLALGVGVALLFWLAVMADGWRVCDSEDPPWRKLKQT